MHRLFFLKPFLLKYLQHTLEIQCLIVHISCPKVYALLSFAVVGGLSKVNIYQSNSNGKNSKVFEQKGDLLNIKANIDPMAVLSRVKPG